MTDKTAKQTEGAYSRLSKDFAFALACPKMHRHPVWYPGLNKKKQHCEFSSDADVVSTLEADEKRKKPEVICVCFDVVHRLGRQLTPDAWRRPHKR